MNLSLLKQDLASKKISKSQLAIFLGISRPTVIKILNGKADFTLSQIKIIKRILDYDEYRMKHVFGL